jgi:hypothetical protein
VFKVKENLKRVINFLTGLFVVVFLLVFNIKASAQQADGSTAAAKVNTDSLAKANKQRADSLKSIRAYKESKHYRDSVATSRQKHLTDQKTQRQHSIDSLAQNREHNSEVMLASRKKAADSVKVHNDSLKTTRTNVLTAQKDIRQHRTDSIAVIRKYKLSKHYRDSVQRARTTRQKALTKIRLHTTDSIRAVQMEHTDSLVAVRKHSSDSMKSALTAMKAIRKHAMDSMKTIRAARTDSLGKARLARAERQKQKNIEKEKKRVDKLKLALEIKIKKSQAKYNNQDMRKKKWTLPRQAIQNTFTRYNYYFNANKKMQEALVNMVRSHVNNYDSLITLFPFDPDKDSTKLKSDMDTIIRKAALGIQIHDPRAKWQDDLYLLMGQAYYYKGDYQNAGAAFKTIVSESEKDKKEKAKLKGSTPHDKTKPASFSEPDKTGIAGMLEHRTAENEALLWLSRTLTQSKKEGQAQTVLDLVHNDPNFPERLKGKLALEQAFIDICRQDYTKVVTSLNVVANDKELPKWLRLRASYLNGQLLQRQLHYVESDQYFNLALDLNPNLEMEFYAKKNLAINSINNGSSTYTADNLLEKMSNDDKFKPYFDQIFFAMGKAALKNKQNDAALVDFKKSVHASKNNRKQKGLSFAALGDEYYLRSDYSNAKFAYDSASMFLSIADDPVFSLAKRRAEALDLVAVPGNVVKTQDSLIRMAALSEKEQRAIIHNYVKALERRMRDSIFQAQNAPAQNGNNLANNNLNNRTGVTWYFANPNLMRQGENDFKQKWGNRTLKDNWRVSSSSSFAGTNSSTDEPENTQSQDELNLPNEDSLYAAIPHTPAALALANDQLEQGLFDLGKAYYTSLEDYEKSINTFDTLDVRYQNDKNKAEELYTRYLISMRQNHPDKAAGYNKELQQKFHDSEWARLLSGENQEAGDANPFPNAVSKETKDNISNYYDETYGLLMQRQYNDVLIRIKDADANYKNQGAFRKKFTLMKAVAVAGNGNYPKADTLLHQFISANPNDSLTSWANAVLAYIKIQPGYDSSMHPLGKPGLVDTSKNKLNTDTSKVKALSDTSGNSNSLNYQYKPNSVHYVIISAPSSPKFAGLRSGISDYNLMKQGKESVTVSISTLDVSRSLIVCKEFPTAADAKKYMTEIKNVNVLFREFNNNEYDVLLISAENFPKLFLKKDYAFYKAFYSKNYK